MVEEIKPGWQTTEFWTTLFVSGVALAILGGWLTPGEGETIETALVKVVEAVAVIVGAVYSIVRYGQGRVNSKNYFRGDHR